VDPWYVHCGTTVRSCGSGACEAEEYARLLAKYPDAIVSVETEPGAGIFVVGDDAA
jgi:hypothetical protein